MFNGECPILDADCSNTGVFSRLEFAQCDKTASLAGPQFFACNTDTFSSQQLSRKRPHLDEVNFSVIFTTAINIHDASLTLLDLAYIVPIKPREGGGHSGQKRGGRGYYLVTLKLKVLLTLICPQN